MTEDPTEDVSEEKKEVLAYYESFARLCFPGIKPDTHQYTSMRRAFLSGALMFLEVISRPEESEAKAMRWSKAFMDLSLDETKLPPDPNEN